MVLLSKAAILAAPLDFVDVEVPEWGGAVRLQAFSVKRRFEIIEVYKAIAAKLKAWEIDQELPEAERTGVEKPHIMAESTLNLLYAIVDVDGDPLFTADEFHLVENLSYASLDRVYRAFLNLNTPQPTEEALEAKKKTLKRTPRSKSSSR